ncbi:MAG: hypothetical protein N2554_01880 [Fimbriimonadales bacterium]|nr:hypothetical protein [Fimbriimonadales bacterium]
MNSATPQETSTDEVTKEQFLSMCRQYDVDYWVALRQVLIQDD